MPQRRSAFTLLEVLIASALLSTLMLVVWSLFSTFTRLEERSSRAATELQLVRSISRQLRSDIEHFATLAPKPEPKERKSTQSPDATTQDATPFDFEKSEDANDVPPANPNEITTSVQIEIETQPELGRDQLQVRQEFESSLLDAMFLRGSATKLELVTRLPYTVDVPTGNQLLGSETRYGTHQLVIYEWRDIRNLESLLKDDPILNPAKFTPPPPVVSNIQVTNPLLPPPASIVPTRLNPNDNVGLIRESKSWLHITRDQRKNALMQQAQSAGMLVDGKLPWEVQPLPQEPLPTRSTLASPAENYGNPTLPVWTAPPEYRHRRDHIPEVTRLQFRYFDGEAWRLDWNDADAIPIAIEIAFDLDPDAPAVRAKEFEAAHAAMLSGDSLTQVLPPKDDLLQDELTSLDPLATLNTLDPTAIVTEYRFVIGLVAGPAAKSRDDDTTANEESDSASVSEEVER